MLEQFIRMLMQQQAANEPLPPRSPPRLREFMDMNIFEDPKPGRGPMPFRPPGQEGPIPPVGNQFSAMLGGRR